MELVQRIRRELYRGRRPGQLARALNRLQGELAARGIGPKRIVMLQVRGRSSGRTISLPVVVADLDGEEYLVSMFGDSASWVRNVRASGGAAVIRHGATEAVHLEEVDPAERPVVLRRYLAVAPGARAHIPVDPRADLSEFQQVADKYPVFRIVRAHAA